jgi:ASPIC and UnbV/FG-GAP-like repeat
MRRTPNSGAKSRNRSGRANALTRVCRALCAVIALASTACAGGEPPPAAAKVIPGSTARMADTLAAIYARSIAKPESNPFLNAERVVALKTQLAAASGDQAMELRFQLAEEEVKAGRTGDAIERLEALIRDAKISWDSIAPHQKPFFDMLAVSYMRLGEQQNCLENPAANICILPLAGAARHLKKDGARGAIERYTKILRQYPDDRGSQWLLNLAYLQLGEYPQDVPRQYLIPNLAPQRAAGAFPEYRNIAGPVGLAQTGLAGGLDFDDLNGDGLLDVFTTGWGLNDPVHVYLADGKGGYTDRSANAGLVGIVGGLNSLHADYDNDGDVDIVVLRGAWMRESGLFPLSLLRNRGDGTFDDVTFDSGLLSFGPTNTASWADFNLDGYLDLFVGYESYSKLSQGPSHPSKLFLNNRDGTFSEVASKVGIAVDDFVKGASWGDVNNDGLPDLYLSVIYGRNKLFLNRGGMSMDTWRFEETGAAAGVQLPIASFPTFFFDYDNDGNEDLFVPSYDVNSAMHEMVAREYLGLPLEVKVGDVTVGFEDAKMFRNKGDGTFEDVTAKVGLNRKVIFAMGSNIGDIDNDGWIDFYIGTGNPDLRSVIPNRLFRNVAGMRFEEVTLPGGFGHLQKGHAVAFADLDRDGDEDVYARIGGAYSGDLATSVLFENPGWPATSWINLKLEGRAANRSAIGARVDVTVVDAAGAARHIHRTVRTGGSFGAGPLELHVGLGAATSIASVRIAWPDSARSSATFTGLAPNRYYRITQGAQPLVLTRPPVPFRRVAATAAAPMAMPH